MSSLNQFSPLFTGYMPAQVKHLASGWYIEYYVTNPMTKFLERKKFRLNALRSRCRTMNEFKVQALSIACQLNVKLAQGWTPFAEYEANAPGAIPMDVIIDRYLKDIKKDLRADTLRTYTSFCKMFLEWCNQKAEGLLLKDFSDTLAVRYLDEQREARQWANSTYNNNLVSAQALFTWCVNKKYLAKNPFFGIPKKKKEKKKRTVVRANVRDIIRDYFKEKQPGYLLICELVFHSLIRPAEISRLRVRDVDLANKVIHLDGSITKTKFDRKAILCDELIDILRESIENAHPNDFLVSNGYKPGAHAISTKMYRKTWAKMREDCDLPDTMQLYSLRDSGIISLFDNGADANTVKQAADHHNLNITTIYCDHVDEDLVEKVRQHSEKF